MTRDQVLRWAKTKVWDRNLLVRGDVEVKFAMDHAIGMLVCVTPPAYAECQGPDDVVCGRARFSVHGCNGAPSRAEYLLAVSL